MGSVVKTAQDDDPIALLTVLNTRTHKEQEWMGQLRAFLRSKCPTEADRKRLEEVGRVQ